MIEIFFIALAALVFITTYIAACEVIAALLVHSLSGEGSIRWLAATSMAVIAALAVLKASLGKLGNWGIEDGQPEEEDHRGFGKRRHHLLIQGHTDTNTDGQDRGDL